MSLGRVTGNVAFVAGTDVHGANPPQGYPHRFAVLTWLELAGSQLEPWDLVAKAFPDVALAVGAHTIVEEQWERREAGIFRRQKDVKLSERPWQPWTSQEAQRKELPFPVKFRLEAGETTILHVETEFWSLVGGPPPYHDSVTLSIFSREERSDVLKGIFTRAALALNYSLSGLEPLKDA